MKNFKFSTMCELHSSVVWFYKSCRLAWKNNGFTLWLFSLNILLVLCACAPIKIPPYPIDRVETLGQSMTRQDVTVSLHVLNDPEEIELYFGTDLLEQGLVPVLVRIENNHPQESVVLLKNQVRLKSGGQPDQDNVADALGTVNRQGSAEMIAGGVVCLPLSILGVHFFADSTAIRVNLLKKELKEQTLPPGSSDSGFLYFQVNVDLETQGIKEVSLKCLQIGTQKELEFVFQVNL